MIVGKIIQQRKHRNRHVIHFYLKLYLLIDLASTIVDYSSVNHASSIVKSTNSSATQYLQPSTTVRACVPGYPLFRDTIAIQCSLEKNKENGLKRKTCQKQLLEKLPFKKTKWSVYKRTRKDEYYTNYKEALNAAEIRKYKRSYEQTLACNV